MTNTRKILLAVVAVVIVGLLAFLLVTDAANKQQECTFCHGKLEQAASCGDCLTDEEGNATGKVEATIDGETVLVDCTTCEGTAHYCENCEGAGEVTGSFWALLPPIIASVLRSSPKRFTPRSLSVSSRVPSSMQAQPSAVHTARQPVCLTP